MLIDPEDFVNSLKQKDSNYISIIHRLAIYHLDINNLVYQIKSKNNEYPFIVDVGDSIRISYVEDLEDIEGDYTFSDFNSVLKLVSH